MNILTGKNEIPKQVRNDKVKRKMALLVDKSTFTKVSKNMYGHIKH